MTTNQNLFFRTYKFIGANVALKDRISFIITNFGTSINISWNGAEPIKIASNEITTTSKLLSKKNTKNGMTKINSTNNKKSFEPISDSETTILILGTIPSDKSLELQEYYGNSRNRFWKIISTITDNELPVNYSDKKNLLLRSKIGVWDVAQNADRKGSLDSEIKNEKPNNLDNFIAEHKNLKVIGFNGKKSEAIFKKYFDRQIGINYISLPSSSPANAGFDLEKMIKYWRKLLIK